jgi:hypothetical protein
MSNSPHNRRFPRILRCVVDSRYIRAIRTVYSRFAQMHVNLTSSYNDQIAMILAKLALHSTSKAFKLYCEKNPWAAEAKMYDV